MPPQPPRVAYEGTLKARSQVQQAVHARFTEHSLTALAYPTTFEPAPVIGDMADVTWQDQTVQRIAALARSTSLSPCCAHPGLVVPAGLSTNGLPIGLEFDALPGADRQLLGLGLALEHVLGSLPAPTV
jgi:mandelamide amidase